jgi:hypothetical protein
VKTAVSVASPSAKLNKWLKLERQETALMSGSVKGIGRGQAYDSLQGRKPRAASGTLWVFRFRGVGWPGAGADVRVGAPRDDDRWTGYLGRTAGDDSE